MFKIILSFLCIFCIFAKDGLIVSKGNISALSSESITVNGKSYVLTESTKYEDAVSNTISLSALKIGDFVEVKGVLDGSTLVAEKVELEQSSSSDDSSNNNNDSPNDDSPTGNNNSSNKIKDSLTIIDGSGANSTGKIDYRVKGGKKVTKRLTVNIKVPVGSTAPSLPTISSAKTLTLLTKFYRAGELVASCKLKYDRTPRRVKFAEYKLDLEVKNRRVKNNKGACNNGITTQKIFPSLEAGDQVIVSETAAGSFLEGTL